MLVQVICVSSPPVSVSIGQLVFGEFGNEKLALPLLVSGTGLLEISASAWPLFLIQICEKSLPAPAPKLTLLPNEDAGGAVPPLSTMAIWRLAAVATPVPW